MPMTAGTTDTPSTAPPFADTLGPNRAPATSATSDRPVIAPEAEETPTVDSEGKAANTEETAAENAAGEADGEPNKTAGEDGDKTPPQQRAAFARERNRRQAAEQRATALETKFDQLLETVSKLVPKNEPKADPRPTRDKFEDPDAYDQALVDWSARAAKTVALQEASVAQQTAERERQFNGLRDAYAERVSQFEADHPDYEDVVMSDDLKISAAMSQVILEAEDGPAIAYHLGQNPDVAERLAKLSPAQAALEIGKISTRLANPPKPRPEPIKPLAARNSAGPKSAADESMEEYGARRLREIRTKVN